MATRRKSAFQSLTSASHHWDLEHRWYHWMPCVLMPRSWTGLPYWLHSCTPHTRSSPVTSCGRVPPGVPGCVRTVTAPEAPDRLPAASRARTVKVYEVSGVRPLTVWVV